MCKHLIWDFDGTLFDTYPTMVQAFIKALKSLGIEESYERIMKLMKVSQSHLMGYCLEQYHVGDELKRAYNIIKRDMEFDYFKPFDNVLEICNMVCEQGGKNYLYTHRGVSAIEHMKGHGLYEYFSDFITKDNNFKRKPHPEALLDLINRHGIPRESALMIGDRDIDLEAGKNAGICACYFTNGETSTSQYADYTILNFAELKQLI